MAIAEGNGPADTSGCPRVTIETDAGPVELVITYTPIGEPVYADVPSEGAVCADEAHAEAYGAWIVKVGNWRSFRVEKRYFAEGAV